MHYDIKKILCTSALALIFGLYAGSALAQGVVSLAPDAETQESLNSDIPDEISLFDDSGSDDALSGLIVPPADSSMPIFDTDAVPTEEILHESSGIQPKTGAIVPKTGAIQPKTGAIVPKTGAIQPKTGAIIPKTGAIQPKTGAIQPKTGIASESSPLMAGKGGIGVLGNNDFEIDDKVFAQMSDLEKQTALLSLELRREKIKNEIEAIKNQRLKAEREILEKEQEQKRKDREKEQAHEKQMMEEQQKLRTIELSIEKARQEKYLKAYKNQMLKEMQKWIKNNAGIYKEMDGLRKERSELVNDIKNKLSSITAAANNVKDEAIRNKEAHARQVSDLETQIAILKARIDAQEKEMEKQNPFADDISGGVEKDTSAETTDMTPLPAIEQQVKLADLYAVMEIRGQGEELVAKLINAEGHPFMVKKGTTLQTGHVIDAITQTYVRTDKNGMKEHLYFASGGILDREPPKSNLTPDVGSNGEDGAIGGDGGDVPGARDLVTSDGIPGMGADMMVR